MNEIIIHHVSQCRQMTVRVDPDAYVKYSNDDRWQNISKEERQFAFGIIEKISGKECPVCKTEYTKDGLFYHILINPKIKVWDGSGSPIEIGIAFVPCDYVKITTPDFWRAS